MLSVRILPWAGLAVLSSLRAQGPGLPATSPFSPPANSSATAGVPESVEFAGVSVVGNQTMISLYDTVSKHGTWLAVGGKANGAELVSYDPKREQVVVRMYGQLKILNLRRGSISGATAGPALPATYVPEPAPAIASISENPAPPPGEKKEVTQRQHEEEEARMFVSDMLEIGMQHRKAYEDAQKNSGPSAGLTSGVPAGTPYTPTLFPATPAPQASDTSSPSSPTPPASTAGNLSSAPAPTPTS